MQGTTGNLDDSSKQLFYSLNSQSDDNSSKKPVMKIQNVDMSGLRRNTEDWIDYRYSMKPSSIVTPADYELVGAPPEKRTVNMGMAKALLQS